MEKGNDLQTASHHASGDQGHTCMVLMPPEDPQVTGDNRLEISTSQHHGLPPSYG